MVKVGFQTLDSSIIQFFHTVKIVAKFRPDFLSMKIRDF